MKQLLFVLTAMLCYTSLSSQTVTNKILGKWINDDKTRVVEFIKNGSGYDAIIREAENSEVLGKKQITGLIPSGEKSFKNGVVHIIQKNATLKCQAELVNDKKLKIKASKGIISKTQIWTRYNEEK